MDQTQSFCKTTELMKIFFKNSCGHQIEFFVTSPQTPRAAVIFWPSSMTNSQSLFYEIPIKTMSEQGIATVLYHPRGHGASEGSYNPEAGAKDLNDWIVGEKSLQDIPVYGVGHSGGASGLLMCSRINDLFEGLFLVSPILDARESLKYMYDSGEITHFQKLFEGMGNNSHVIQKIIANPQWMDVDYWKREHFKEKLNFSFTNFLGMRFENIGIFLEEIFIQSNEVKNDMIKMAHKISIYLPQSDFWYPLSIARDLAKHNGIPIHAFPEAKEHFCFGAWKKIWSETLNSISSHLV